MSTIYLDPYTIIENQNYTVDTIFTIKSSDFKETSFQDGRFTFCFTGCSFKKLKIENLETIDFKNISIQFIDCFIMQIDIQEIITTNISIHFGSSVLDGKITNNNLQSIYLNNCILNDSLFLHRINKVIITYTEENIFPKRWKKLLYKIGKDYKTIISLSASHYYIYDCKNITFSINESEYENKGLYLTLYNPRLAYYLTDNDKQNIDIKINIHYTAEFEHERTKILNARLTGLSLTGFCSGDIQIENSKIDNIYFRNLTVQKDAILYNIHPNNLTNGERKLEIHKSNLEKFTFDNFSFIDYSSISFYRNKFDQISLISCNFPDSYKDFEKFKTVENIHYPDKKDDNYYKTRYEVFLQLKKALENSGNFYEAQKFQAISNESLKQIEKIPYWDKFILNINGISNNHGLSITQPFQLIIGTSIFLYILYLWSLNKIFICTEIDWNLFGYYFSFLDITHRNNFLVEKKEFNGLSLTIDYINKVIVGFLIYQFIASFRKYGKSK